MRHAVWILALLALPTSAQQKNWFEYDPSALLDYRETLISTRAGVRIYDFSYASPKGGRVRAYTVAPDRKAGSRVSFGSTVAGRIETGFCRMRLRWLKQEPYRS